MRRVVLPPAVVLVVMLAATVAEAADWRDSFTLTFSERARGELVDFFRPPDGAAARGAQRYAFFGSQMRAGLRATFPSVQVVVEAQDTRIAGLPDDASLAAPLGNLGPGATYYAYSRDRVQGETFLKQGYLTLRRSGLALTLGRFEFSDGLETVPADATLAFVKRARLAERLVGPFGYTHVTRSFDGVRLAYDQPLLNVTAFASRPTAGGFEISANREITDIGLALLAVTLKQLPNLPPTDVRLFYLFYEDERVGPLKADNRPLPIRTADTEPIRIHTWGGHAAIAAPAGPGTVDALGWLAVQAGEWGVLDHGAWAFAVEAGYQLPRLPASPWLRIGYDRSGGDDDPDDGAHRTFFQVIPTPRIYAQFPFYNLMNVGDAFAQLLLRPDPRVTVRADYHWLRLSAGRDLWYSGGGAANDDVFGFAGFQAAGRRELAHVAEIGVSVALTQRLSFYGFYAHAFGQGVVDATFAGNDADYGYLELTFKY
jgi:hypothetical protein